MSGFNIVVALTLSKESNINYLVIYKHIQGNRLFLPAYKTVIKFGIKLLI